MSSIKTWMKLALGIGVLLGIAYIAFPQYRSGIAAFAPYLFLLACPLAMYFMMDGMHSSSDEKKPDRHEHH